MSEETRILLVNNLKPEDYMIITDNFRKLDKEIERLNNIINELEKYINETKLEEFEKVYGKRYGKTFTQAEVVVCNMILDKLQELKEINEPSFEEMVNFVENVYQDIKNQSTLDEELKEERERIAKIVGDFKGADKNGN